MPLKITVLAAIASAVPVLLAPVVERRRRWLMSSSATTARHGFATIVSLMLTTIASAKCVAMKNWMVSVKCPNCSHEVNEENTVSCWVCWQFICWHCEKHCQCKECHPESYNEDCEFCEQEKAIRINFIKTMKDANG